MLRKEADSISDFKVIDDGGYRRVSVFGMGWTGFTLQYLDTNELEKMAHYFYILGREHGIAVTKEELGVTA
jgi:hypothetical protein